MRTLKKTSREEAFGLLRDGRFSAALEAVILAPDGTGKLPLDFFEVFFPPDETRQDLINSNITCEAALKAEAPAFRRARRSLIKALGTSEPDGEGAALLAYCDLCLGDCDASLRNVERALRTAPSSYGLHLFHAACLWLKTWRLKSRQLQPEALKAMDRALAHEPRRAEALMFRAGIRRELEDLEGHLEDTERALKVRPRYLWALAEKAENLGEAGHYRRALSVLNRLIKLRPEKSWIWVHRARLRAFNGYYEKAMRDFDLAARLDPGCGPIYAWRGETRRRLGDYRGALEDLEKSIGLEPAYRFPHLWKGRIYLIQGDYERAVAAFERTLELEPREQLAASWRAEACWKMGRCRDAALGFESVQPAEPHMAWNRRLDEGQAQEVKFFMGKRQSQAKRDEAFAEDLDRVVDARPGDAWAWAFRGRCRAARGDLRQAIADLTRAIAMSPRDAYAHRWRGEALRRLGHFSKALADLDQALLLEPEHPWAAASRALVRAALGDAAGAETDFALALARPEQRLAVVFLWKGEWLYSRGRVEEARAAFESSFILEGKDARTLQWRKRLSKESGRKELAGRSSAA